MAWTDLFKLWNIAFTKDPLSRKDDTREFPASGTPQPDVPLGIRDQDAGGGAGGTWTIRLQSNEMVDLTSTQNRIARYKEYDRLRSVAEIEHAMTVYADETCLAGDTPISTVFWGEVSIEWLAKNKAGERFAVYCYDEEKGDYVIGWAYDPRKTKRAKTVRLKLDDGTELVCTPDHRILMRAGEWSAAGYLKPGDELMPFYRLPADQHLTQLKTHQFPRIFTHNKGWVHERQFIDEWRVGKDLPQYARLNKCCRLLASGSTCRETAKQVGHDWHTVENTLHKEGFTTKELKALGERADRRRVIGVEPGPEIDVYDLTVEGHHNFCTKSLVVHNCQRDENNNVFKVECKNKEVVDELEFLFFHRNMLNMNRRMWNIAKNLFIKGDHFFELVINPDAPRDGLFKAVSLPPETMYRIETTRGRVVEFQQSDTGPDHQAIERAPVEDCTDEELKQANAIRFAPNEVVHIKIGDDRRQFMPYGVSLIEAARAPAHQLRMMEDAMVVYRLTRAPERRVFYIDVGGLPSAKAEAFIDRMKDQFRKKKIATQRSQQAGASMVEERWHAPAQDEDYWLPIRPNSNTRIDTLPGAQNLGEIDDTVYFRNKLFVALNFPRNHMSNEDPQATRITLSAQDVKFARFIERLQSNIEDGLWEIADRHLTLRGFPEDSYDDLKIKMTPPSDWRELSRAEVVTNRINNANSLKQAQLMSDFDVLTKWMKYDEEEAKQIISRMKIQKLEDLKLQIIAQNPQLLGVGVPGQGETEIGTQPGGPSPMLGPDGMGGGGPPGGPPGMGGPPMGGPPGMGGPPPGMPPAPPPPQGGDQMAQPGSQAKPLPEPSEEDIYLYDLALQDYDAEQDVEDMDYSEAW